MPNSGEVDPRPGQCATRCWRCPGRASPRPRGPPGHRTVRVLGRRPSIDRKADAQCLVLEMESDMALGSWIDPRGAETLLAQWAEEVLHLSRRLSPGTQQTYRTGGRSCRAS